MPKKIKKPKKTAAEKLQEIIGGERDAFSDKSASWVVLEGRDYGISFSFSGDGQQFLGVDVFKKVWECTDQPIIARIGNEEG